MLLNCNPNGLICCGQVSEFLRALYLPIYEMRISMPNLLCCCENMNCQVRGRITREVSVAPEPDDRALNPTPQVRECVSAHGQWVTWNGRKFPGPQNRRGFSSRACCYGLVSRPDIMAGSIIWWLTVTERRVQGLTISRICLPWSPFLPIGYTSYRCTTGGQTNFEQSKWPLRHFRFKPYMVKNHD